MIALRTKIFHLLLVPGGLLIVIYASYCGILLTDDSYNYISAARSFIETGRFLSPDGSPFSSWPPLFSMVIATVVNSPGNAMAFLQYFTYGLNGVLIILIARKHLSGDFYRTLYITISLFSVSLLMIHVFLWSEALFLSLFLLYVLLMERYLVSSTWENLIILILLINIMCLQRNAGMLVLIGTILFLFLERRGNPVKTLVLLLLGPVSFFSWNFYSSYMFSDGFNFIDHDYFQGFLHNLLDILRVVTAWFVPGFIPWAVRIAFFILIFILMVRIRVFRWIVKAPLTRMLFYPVLTYTLLISCIGRLDYYEIDRYLSFIFPLVVLVIVVLIENVSIKRNIKRIMVVLIGVWAVYTVARGIKNAHDWHKRSCDIKKMESFYQH